jgi:hypothetical protein
MGIVDRLKPLVRNLSLQTVILHTALYALIPVALFATYAQDVAPRLLYRIADLGVKLSDAISFHYAPRAEKFVGTKNVIGGDRE